MDARCNYRLRRSASLIYTQLTSPADVRLFVITAENGGDLVQICLICRVEMQLLGKPGGLRTPSQANRKHFIHLQTAGATRPVDVRERRRLIVR